MKKSFSIRMNAISFHLLFFFSCFSLVAQTTTFYDFNTPGQLATYFNGYGPQLGSISEQTTGGVSNSGSLSIPLSVTNAVFSTKDSYSMSAVGSTYRFESVIRSQGGNGYSGLGFTTTSPTSSITQTSPSSGGNTYRPASGIGVSVAGSAFIFHNGATDYLGYWNPTLSGVSYNSSITYVKTSNCMGLINSTNSAGSFSCASPEGWYKLVLIVVKTGTSTFNMRLEVWRSNAEGTLLDNEAGSIMELNGVTNTSIASAPSIYSYFNFSGIRFTRFDNYSIGLSGGATVVAAGNPVVLTSSATQNTNATSFALSGNVTASNGTVSERGFVYGTSTNPTIANNKLTSGTGAGIFTVNTPSLVPGTYYFRSFATNTSGTSYGEEFVRSTNLSELGGITIVSSGGDLEGTKWLYSNNTIYSTSNLAVNLNASDVLAKMTLGNLTISGGGITVNADIIYTTNSNSLTLNTVGAINQNNQISINGPITVYGGTITANANLVTTNSSNAPILLQGKKVFQNQGVLVQTNGSNINYNVTNSPWTAASDQGISLGTANGTIATINAQGGDISLASSFASTGVTNTSTNPDVAILVRNSKIKTSGSGTVALNGNAYDNASTNGDFIWGLMLHTNEVIQTEHGAISITGTGGKTNGNARGIIADNTALKVLSVSGPITFTEVMPNGHSVANHTGTYFKPSATESIKIGADGTLVTNSTSNVVFNVARITFDGTIASTVVNTSGTVTLQPVGNQFDNAISLAGLNLSNTVSGLTIGKPTNTANVTFGSATSIAGPITTYGGTIAINQNLTSTLSGAPILLQATGAINLAANKTIQSNTGNITFRSNAGGTAISAASSIILNSGSALASQGGNITLGGNFTGAQGAGLYATSGNSPAILINGGIISAAGGNIKLYGKCSTSYDDGIRLLGTINTTGSGTVELYGEAHGGNNGTDYFGGITFGSSAGSTIETENGNLILNGFLTNTQSNSTGAINFYRNDGSTGQTRHINLLSKTGNVTITADIGTTGAYGIGHSSWGNVYVGSPASGWTASGNVVFNYSRLVNAGYNGIKVKTTGAVTYQPIGLSFTATQTFPANSNYVLAERASSLTIGKPSNTASLTLGSAVSVEGSISIYGGDISVSDDITSTAGGDITLLASNGFYTSGSASIQRDINTSGGNILIEADSDANGTGVLDLDYMVLNPGSGNTIVRGETYSWVTTSESTKPWINGTGSFTLESNDASIGQNTDLVWFKIDQDANGIGGLNIGKSTNSQPVNFNSVGALTVNGPVNVNGSNVTFSTPLSVTNNDLNIRATGAVTQTTLITASGLALNGTGTFTLANTSNNFQTIAGGAAGTLLGATQVVDASGGLIIGTVGNNTGIIGSGTIRIETLDDNLTLSSNISTTSTSTDAVILTSAKNTAIGVATGGDIIISGTPTITMGTGGIAKLFSGYDLTSTGLTTLAGGSSNVRYNYDETSTTFNPTLSANNKYAIYRTALGYGDLTIVSSGGDAEGTTWTYENGVIKTTSGTANILNTVVQTKLNSGNLSIEANKITFSANITGATNNSLSILSKTHIVNTNATTITTQGGNILFASNVDETTDGESTTNGYIQLRQGITVNSNGGSITFGGGNISGSDYSLGSSAEDYTEGIRFDGVIALNSGGGNIALRGKSYARGVQWGYGASGIGFYFFNSALGTINSGIGTITIDGYSQTHTSTYAAGFYCMHNLTITSANTTSNAINITGKATGASGEAWGIETEGIFSLLATGIGGGITINTSKQLANDYDAVFRAEANILAVSGPINIKTGQLSGITNGYLYLNGHMYLGSRAGSAVTSSSSSINLQVDRVAYDNSAIPKFGTSGSVTIQPIAANFGMDIYTSYFNFNQNGQTMTNFTFGKYGNAGNLYLNSAFTVAGPISAYGGYVEVSNTITSSATGDILLKGIANTNASVAFAGGGITKSAGTGTLTMQGHGRTQNSGAISATGTGVLNVIMWSDYDGDNVGGGSTLGAGGSISTNGGHIWMGGSNSNGGSYTWNGLTVGDGPSTGASGANCHAIDLFGPITTGGGDVLLWASNNGGCGTSGIVSDGTRHINAGSGDITLIAYQTSGGIDLTSTGVISLVPNAGSYPSALTLGGTLTSGNFTFNTSHYNGIKINSFANVGGLTIGKYEEMLSAETPILLENTSNITVGSAFNFGGAVSLYGGAIALNANLSTTNTTSGNILLNCTTLSGTGNIALATNRIATLNVSLTSTYDGIISGTGSGLTKIGAGLLTLTKDHTYSGATTISGGDLQVGTGGSVSQASSGTIAATSGVAVSSGSKLILTPNENIIFAAPISGAGGLEIKGASGKYFPSIGTSWLTTSPVQLAANTTVLEALTRITGGKMGGTAITSGPVICVAYQKSYTALNNTATLQLQAFNGDSSNSYTKCVFLKLTQSGSNVMIQVDNSKLSTGAGYKNGSVLGTDISIGGLSMTLSTSGGSGYGISEVFMSGKVNFTGLLSYSGNTVLSNTVSSSTATYTGYNYTSKGTQEITDASSSFPSASNVINNGLVIFNRTTPLTIASNMEGTEEVLQVGAAITLTGTNTHSGNTTIDLNKSLIIGDGSNLGSITGNIINYGTLTFNRSDSSSYQGIISGSGFLTKLGEGSHTLTGLNTYSGATTITAGKLILERDIPATSSTLFSGSGHLVIQPASSSFTNAISYPISGFTISSDIGGLTIGKPSNTKNITFASTTAVAGPILAYGGDIAINGALTATNSSISLQASGTVTQTAAITANNLELSGIGSFTLTNTSNNVGTIAGGTLSSKLGSLTYIDSNELTIGTLTNSGIIASGKINIQTLTNNLNLNSNVVTDNTASDAIILNAGKSASIGTTTGGDIIVSGTPSVTTGTNGIAKLYSGSAVNSTGLTSLVGGLTQV
ncbi:MAG: autotransporter-associated beta strand repeat-containing protein, partial [Flavobacterium sp.]|nr:autotransporter-associated beta strand repeat-containing protein [Flavobacterium sp.]